MLIVKLRCSLWIDEDKEYEKAQDDIRIRGTAPQRRRFVRSFRYIVGCCGALVESMSFDRRVVGSNPALVAK